MAMNVEECANTHPAPPNLDKRDIKEGIPAVKY